MAFGAAARKLAVRNLPLPRPIPERAVNRLRRKFVGMTYLHHTSFRIDPLGVLVVVFGVVGGLVRFRHAEIAAARRRDVDDARKRLRHSPGYYLLLGLEFLIAADIIDTLMKPGAQDLLVLGAIIGIRTVIGLSPNAELKSDQRHQAAST